YTIYASCHIIVLANICRNSKHSHLSDFFQQFKVFVICQFSTPLAKTWRPSLLFDATETCSLLKFLPAKLRGASHERGGGASRFPDSKHGGGFPVAPRFVMQRQRLSRLRRRPSQ